MTNECPAKRPLWIVALVTILISIGIYCFFISTKSFKEQYLIYTQKFYYNPFLVHQFQSESSAYKMWQYVLIVCSIVVFIIAVGLWKMKKWGVVLYEIILLPAIVLLIIGSKIKILRIVLKEGVIVLGNTVYIILVLCLIAVGISLISLWRNGKLIS